MAHLRNLGLIRSQDSFDVLYGGRTNQVWKLRDSRGDKVLKLYRSAFHNPLFRNDPDLEAACLSALAKVDLAPRLCAAGQFEAESWVLYDHAPGTPWQTDPRPVARVLRKLHDLPPALKAPKGCNGSADLLRHGDEILQLCSIAQRAELAQLRPKPSLPALERACLIHGDPVAGNVLIAGGRALLIDWQCPALGDPAEDLAMFLSPAMQHLYRGKILTAAEEAQFLTAYGDPEITARYAALRPCFHWRMAAYCLWRSMTGAPDYTRGYHLERAALHQSELLQIRQP